MEEDKRGPDHAAEEPRTDVNGDEDGDIEAQAPHTRSRIRLQSWPPNSRR